MLTLTKFPLSQTMSQSARKKGDSGLGRAILKERNRGKSSHGQSSWVSHFYLLCSCVRCVFRFVQLHTSELDDGYDWNKLNLRSVTEENQLDEFLRTAELAGTEFTAGE